MKITAMLTAPIRNIRMAGKMRLLIVIVLVGMAASLLASLFLIGKVRIGSDLYAQIKQNKDVLEQIAKLSSKLNQYRAEMSIIIDETDKDKASGIRQNMDRIKADVNAGFDGLLSAITNEEKKLTVQDAQSTWAEFQGTVEKEFLPAVAEGRN